ncbi:MAG: sigma-54-dependent Fis family transcriptional regulator [Myxococcales bacterium]|nr:sigma-54-dependent Fis family transcriptional regulator [Myxococcales bacterium]
MLQTSAGRRLGEPGGEGLARLTVLVVAVSEAPRRALTSALEEAGHFVQAVGGAEQGLSLLSTEVFDVVMCESLPPELDALAVLGRVQAESPRSAVYLMSARASVPEALGAVKKGARDFLALPVDFRKFVSEELSRVAEEVAGREASTGEKPDCEAGGVELLGGTPAITRLRAQLRTMAQASAPVLITGESGTGKELVARILHERGPRRDRPFVAVNCAAFPETLLEEELFGHEKGAFTGAVRRREGRFKAADGGTLLLDEVAELPLPAQAKLLRVLQEGTVEPLGTNDSVRVDVRLVSATHRNLKELIERKLFREDLYYRIRVLEVEIPPLRERRADIARLADTFLRQHAPPGSRPPTIAPRAWAALSEHSFPGNVRELSHAIERGVILSTGKEIDLEHLPAEISGAALPSPAGGGFRFLSVVASEFEREYLRRALRLCGGRRDRAAELLGLSRKNLWEKMRRHHLSDEELY